MAQPSHLGSRWEILATATLDDGSTVEMHYATFGKGRGTMHSWKFFRDGVYLGYASTPDDATENWARVQAGMVRNSEMGRWVQHAKYQNPDA